MGTLQSGRRINATAPRPRPHAHIAIHAWDIWCIDTGLLIPQKEPQQSHQYDGDFETPRTRYRSGMWAVGRVKIDR
jgi:hypothetical protein